MTTLDDHNFANIPARRSMVTLLVAVLAMLAALSLHPVVGLDTNEDREKASCRRIWQQAIAFRDSHVITPGAHIVRFNKNSKADILNVHVGKTCGSTIAAILGRARLRATELHVFNVADERFLHHYRNVLISIREPISRIISAFNFHHPAAATVVDGGGPTKNGDKRFYECFKTIEDYANDINSSSVCGQLARRGYGHMRLGLCHYVGGVRELLKEKPNVFVIEQENCTQQLLEALRLMNKPVNTSILLGSWINKKTKKPFNVSLLDGKRVNSKTLELPKQLSESAERKLRSYLEHIGEYGLYSELKERMGNVTLYNSTYERLARPAKPVSPLNVQRAVGNRARHDQLPVRKPKPKPKPISKVMLK